MIKQSSILIAVLYMLSVPISSCFADAATVKVSCDRRMIYIGDRIKFVVEVRSGRNIEVEFPKFADNKMGEFEIKDFSQNVRKGLFGSWTYTRYYNITTYSTGNKTIPAFGVKFREKGSKDWQQVQSVPLDVFVETMLPKGGKGADIRDIKGPLPIFDAKMAAVIAAISFFAAYLLFFIIKKIKRKAGQQSPYESAVQELGSVKSILSSTGNIKEYYSGVSDCVRRYIERVFKFKASEMTTEEFLNSMKDSSSLSLGHKDLLKDFLNACDMVKFARYTPSRLEIDDVFSSAKKFFDDTRTVLESQEKGKK